MKKLLSVFLAISIFTLASCSGPISDDNQNVNKVNAKKDVTTASKPSIKVYGMAFDDQLNFALDMFNRANRSNNQVSIEATKFNLIDSGVSKSYEELRKKLAADTLAGNGPDIFLGKDILPSINKAISSGVFCDLNELISKDKDFKLSDYYKNILDSGVVDGKRYIFPIEYPCYGFTTTKEVLSQNNISIDDSTWTWKDFAALAKSFADKNKGKDKYLVAWEFDFKVIMTNCGISFIDYDNKKSEFDSPEFIELLQAYKDMYPAILTEDMRKAKEIGDFEIYDKGTALLRFDKVTPVRTFYLNAAIKGGMNSELQILSLPTYKAGSGTFNRLEKFAAINSKCKYKEQAFEFIKLLLSKELRLKWSEYELSTNKNIFKDQLNSYLKSDVRNMERVNFGSYQYSQINITEELFDKTNEIVDRTQGMEIVDVSVLEIIDSELPDLISGRKTAQQVAKKINDKVTLFLNE